MSSFRKATKKASRLRMALCAPPGGGKTFSALRFAMELAGPTGRVCVINTESGAVEKYLGLKPDANGRAFDFDIAEMHDFAPSRYTQLIQEAGREGYDVIVIDSLSHAWAGVGGALELKDKKGGNSFTAWKDITPLHNAMIEAILRSPAHVIATMRTKIGYVLEEEVDPKTGAKKSVPKKIGLEPVQRQGMEYEFDIVADLDQQTHTLTVSKSRCPLVDGAVIVKPGAEFIQPVKAWLEDGVSIDPSYYATKPEDLRAVQDEQRERNRQAEEAAAAEDRRKKLMAMADGVPATNPESAQQVTQQPSQTVTASVEQPPFVPTGRVADAIEAQVQQQFAAADAERLSLSQELVSLGAKVGKTPVDINEGCKKRFNGQGVRDISLDTLRKLVEAFRVAVHGSATPQGQPQQQAVTTGQPAGNPTAA